MKTSSVFRVWCLVVQSCGHLPCDFKYVRMYVCMYVYIYIYIYVYNRRDDTHGTGDGRDDNAKRILTFAASGLQIRPCLDYFTIHPEPSFFP